MKRAALAVLLLTVALLAACGRAQTEKTVLTVEATPAAGTAPQAEASAPVKQKTIFMKVEPILNI